VASVVPFSADGLNRANRASAELIDDRRALKVDSRHEDESVHYYRRDSLGDLLDLPPPGHVRSVG
jgi:hypothetical protein